MRKRDERIRTSVAAMVSLCAIILLTLPFALSPETALDQWASQQMESQAASDDPNQVPTLPDWGASAQLIEGIEDSENDNVSGSLENEDSEDNAGYEPGIVLADATPGVTVEQLEAAFNADEALAGVKVGEQARYYTELILPDTLQVEEAVECLNESGIVENANPNYYLSLADDSVSAGLSSQAQRGTGLSAGVVDLGSSQTGPLEASTQEDATYTSPNDTRYVNGDQWGFASVEIENAWQSIFDKTTGSASGALGESDKVIVAVADNGFYFTGHPDFHIVNSSDPNDLSNDVVYAFNAQANQSTTYTGLEPGSSADVAKSDHGTHVAGIVGAWTNNSEGVAGSVYDYCKLMPIRLTSSAGGMSFKSVCNAIERIVTLREGGANIRVVNMSVGAVTDQIDAATLSQLQNAINDARGKGVVVVAAACNENYYRVNGANRWYGSPFGAYPSDCDNVISVISLQKTAAYDGVVRLSSSNYNKSGEAAKDISAPGYSIWSTSESTLSGNGTWYVSKHGTSMAAPLVAGIMGLMFTANPDLTVDEATSKLYSSAHDLVKSPNTGAGWDEQTGYGEVNAAAAVSDETPYLSGSQVVNAGTPEQFTVKINNVAQPASEWTWASSRPIVAHVGADGTVVGVSPGYTIITATKGDLTACQTVRVYGYGSIEGAEASVDAQTYTGDELTPHPTVTMNGAALTEGVHYRVTSYSSNVNAGQGTLTIEGVSPIGGKIENIPFTINKAPLEKATIALDATAFRKDGEPHAPTVLSINDIGLNAGVVLTETTDYTVAATPITEGSGTVEITATDACANFTGSVTRSFTVADKDITADSVVVTPPSPVTYNGYAQTPTVTVVDGENVLTEGADYTVSRPTVMRNAGDYQLEITGIGIYYGSRTATFTINKAPISAANIRLSSTSLAYESNSTKIAPVVSSIYDIGQNASTRLVNMQDYTYTSTPVALGSGTVRITASSACQNFSGFVDRGFSVVATWQPMYRLYNPNSGEHFYTASNAERNSLIRVGWRNENIGWYAPTAGDNVYRMYNPNAGDHHYTTSAVERDALRRVGWNYEGIGWKSGGNSVLYREYNPNAVSGAHNYTSNKAEHDYLCRIGWHNEGAAWYGR